MHRVILASSAALVLIASGLVHGLWTDRWTEAVDLSGVAKRFEAIPTQIGKWESKEIDMGQDPRLGLAALIARRYVHRETGKVVTILVACGRPGPVCIHTPEVCYAVNRYEVDQKERFTLAQASGAPEFWTARFVRQRNDGQTILRIFWSWHTSDGWKVADNPRTAFAGETYLHKLYVIRELSNPNEPADGDACTEFMQELLPELQRNLFVEPKAG